MEMKKTAFIGAGNMAEAMVRGLLASGRLGKKDITLSDIDPERLSLFASRYGVATASSNREAVKKIRHSRFFREAPGAPRGLPGSEEHRH